MSNSYITPLQDINQFFRPGSHHVPILMRPVDQARVIWINTRVMREDPAFATCGGTLLAYSEHILKSCAYTIDLNEKKDDRTIIGIADRYGGSGIGHNGGSGRAAIINGYHVKGIGRTPLVSALTDKSHASGGAYLEECIRETIFSELVAMEFPFGSIPTLAIILIGVRQVWKLADGDKEENCCLLVRPAFLRPAHLERAQGYIGSDPRDGYTDANRVKHAFDIVKKLWGYDSVAMLYRRLWFNWAEQLAYASAHRLPHGGDSTSNITIHGSLLDFGAMTSIPSWARISLVWGGAPTGCGAFTLARAIREQILNFVEYGGLPLRAEELLMQDEELAMRRYQNTMFREMLRVFGLSRDRAAELLDLYDELTLILGRVLMHFQREEVAVFDGMPNPRTKWDVGAFWSADIPDYLCKLRDFLESKLGCQKERHLCAVRSNFRSRTRTSLFSDDMKVRLYRMLEQSSDGKILNQESLDNLIGKYVCMGRRDSNVEPRDAVPIGYARNAFVGYALFRCIDTNRMFAIKEWGFEPSMGDAAVPKRHYISSHSRTKIAFSESFIRAFTGVVVVK